MTSARIVPVDSQSIPRVIALVAKLLFELGEEGDEVGTMDTAVLSTYWRAEGDRQHAFLALGPDEAAIGTITVSETFAFFANGPFGIINEMYVEPAYRSSGVGRQLVDAVRDLGNLKGWRRIDVTAPESPRWKRTREFYERAGFTFAGPKLKILL